MNLSRLPDDTRNIMTKLPKAIIPQLKKIVAILKAAVQDDINEMITSCISETQFIFVEDDEKAAAHQKHR